MQLDDAPPNAPPELPPLLAAVELQDHLLMVTNDLDRLQRLLLDASDALILDFNGATEQLNEVLQSPDVSAAHREPLLGVRRHIGHAVTALQFQDMAWQLINHTTRRLRSCADQLAREAMGPDADGEEGVMEVALPPNPVAQDEMDAGSVELF